jgi:murein DD-endopeptidase MepM/ murein hydrolase activator NlpD
MNEARAAIAAFGRSVGEIFFVRSALAGGAIWLALAVMAPAAAIAGALALAASMALHGLFRVALSPQLRIWLGVNAFLTGIAWARYFGVDPTATSAGGFFVALLAHQVLYYALLAFAPKQPALPLLTLPFVVMTRLIAWAAPAATGTILWNGMGTTVDASIAAIGPEPLTMFFRSLGTILFVRDAGVGIVIALAIGAYSRVLLSLALLAFAAVWLGRGALEPSAGIELVAFNTIVTVMFIGAVEEIPSRWSYRHAFVFGAVAAVAAWFCIGRWTPVLNIPFLAVAYAYLLARPVLRREGALPFDFTPGTPEQNFYYARNRQERYLGLAQPAFALPFNGEWKVTQGHDGPHTHREEWRHAWDFERVDAGGRVARDGAARLADYYSYRQPIVAALDGEIANLQGFIPDNEIGAFNFRQNWGNTVVIRHSNGQCTAYSHLGPLPETVWLGKWINRGEVIGYCGNSGRSERPHLHFQFQSLPNIGEKTVEATFREYVVRGDEGPRFHLCDVPAEGETVWSVEFSARVAEAFTFPHGRELVVAGDVGGEHREETWIALVDLLNHTYLYSRETGATAYFYADRGLFHFTDYFGRAGTLLDHFSLSASRIVFSEQDGLSYDDRLPLTRLRRGPASLVADVVAPVIRAGEIASAFRVSIEADRAIAIRARTVLRGSLGRRERPAAESHVALPYGTQSIRLIARRGGKKVSMTILY